MKIEQLALHHLSAQNDVIVTDNGSFDPYFDEQAYSYFKYGDGQETQRYSEALAGLLQASGAIDPEESLLVSGSAYQFVPTAAAHLAVSLTGALQRQGFDATHFHTANEAISRGGDVPSGDFSSMTAEQREAVLAVNRPILDANSQAIVKDKKVITVDDIRMTGAHEKTLVELFDSAGVETALFCYLAVFNTVQGVRNSRIEQDINQRYVKDMTDLVHIANRNPFLPNARVSRFVLNASDEDIAFFAQSIPRDHLMSVVLHLEAEGHNRKAKYLDKFLILKSELGD
jgi:hypothetical protein